MEKIKTIIVDDELEAREGVALLIENDPEIDIVAVCANGIEGIHAITEYHPDLVFLDIQMPQINGFEVLNSISDEFFPAVIFTTAYDEYTLKAFEVHAVDYLLKPFTNERFYAAVNHAKKLIDQKNTQGQQLPKLVRSQLKTGQSSQLIHSKESNRLTIKVDGKVYFVPYEEIIWVEAYDYYVKIHIAERYYLLRESLKKLEARLPNPPFLRIHKSSLINRQCLQEIAPQINGNEYQLTLTNGEVLKSSRSYRDQVKALMAN